jgi:sensor histidine kinase YesM
MKLAWILGIGGLILAMIIILTVLYRKSIRPLTKIQSIVRDYTKDKDTEETLARTAEITERNEFGLLSDDIRGMVQEIHDYTEENIRLAGEQERVQKELYEAQVSVMVSQIQPHFMYNALTSIAMMCELDPEKAQEATVIFADYLRGNMDSLKQKAPVPFSVELEHLKKYVYIEQLRFADKLRVEYDIGPTSFSLPQLSVQPLVENAVKHGVGMKKGGGTVTIATRENETSYEVIVSDNGVGFDVAAADQIRMTRSDGRSHVGMENTRKRLHDQCNADVIITSVVGEGTTARIVIPKNDSGQKDESSPKGV